MGWADQLPKDDRFFLWQVTLPLDEPPTAGARVRTRPRRPLSPAQRSIQETTGSRSTRR